MLTVANPGTPLAINLGSPADVTVRPSGDPAGVGLTQRFANLPDTFAVAGVANAPTSVTKLTSTFTGLRLPATCPTPGANVVVSADSYADPSSRSASAPLKTDDAARRLVGLLGEATGCCAPIRASPPARRSAPRAPPRRCTPRPSPGRTT